MKKRFIAWAVIVVGVYSTPIAITVAIFGSYVYSGHDLTPANSFTILVILKILQVMRGYSCEPII